MNVQLDGLINKHEIYVLFSNQKNTYIRSKTEPDIVEKIKYKVDLKDWLIYFDGNTFRKFVRGFAIGSSGIAFCDDNGEITRLTVNEFSKTNISSSGNTIIIAGKCVTIGDTARTISDKLILIKRDINNQECKHVPVKMAKLSEELWYLGYEGEVLGPYSKDKLLEEIKSNKYKVDALQVWTSSYTEWKLIVEVEEFSVFGKNSSNKLEPVSYCLDINNCSKNELMKYAGLSEEKVDLFLKKREAGILLYNEFDLQAVFDLKPHELEKLKRIVVFKVDTIKKKGRILDI